MSERDRLVAWSLATFHTVAFVVIALVLGFRSGGLAASLASLNTLVGFSAFVVLWASTRYTTARALTDGGVTRRDPMPRAYRWAAINAWLFLATLVIAGAVAAPIVNPAGGIASALFVLAFGVIATPFALVIGAVVGSVFRAIDIALLAIARAIVDRCAIGD